jgi:hypothetical protein
VDPAGCEITDNRLWVVVVIAKEGFFTKAAVLVVLRDANRITQEDRYNNFLIDDDEDIF